MNIIDYQDTLENPVLDNDETKGFIDSKYLSSLKDNCSTAVIKKGMEYRPDLISMYYYGTVSNAWLISYVNDFDGGIKDYVAGRTILIPNLA